MVGVLSVDEASRLLTEDPFREVAVQKCVGDIQLMHKLGTGDRQLKHRTNRARFNNRCEGVGEVHSGALAEAAHHPASLVALERPVRTSLMPEDPLASDDVGTGRPRDKLPGAVPLKSIELFLHRSEPMRIPKGGSS